MIKDGSSINEIQNFLRQKGERGKKLLSTMGKNEPFCTDITSPVGIELLKDLVEQIESVIYALAFGDEKRAEREAELRAYQRLYERWALKVNSQIEGYKQLRGTK